MCITDYGLVITGPGSRDGRIAVWESHLAVDCLEPRAQKKKSSVCEEDGFQVVCKKDAVQFDLERNQICYISDTSI